MTEPVCEPQEGLPLAPRGVSIGVSERIGRPFRRSVDRSGTPHRAVEGKEAEAVHSEDDERFPVIGHEQAGQKAQVEPRERGAQRARGQAEMARSALRRSVRSMHEVAWGSASATLFFAPLQPLAASSGTRQAPKSEPSSVSATPPPTCSRS